MHRAGFTRGISGSTEPQLATSDERNAIIALSYADLAEALPGGLNFS
jgi:hypothetical protein